MNRTPRKDRKEFKVTVNGRCTSEETRELLNLPVNPPDPVNYVVKPVVSDNLFIEAYESNILAPKRLTLVADTIERGINSSDEKVAVGTAISERQDLTRVYLQKTKDRKPQQSSTRITPEQLLEHANSPLKWVEYIWPYLGFDRPLNSKQRDIINLDGNGLILMPRQIFGKTTAVSLGKIAHAMIFSPGTPILVATNVEDSAKRVIKIVSEGVKKYADLCGFLQVTKDNEKEFELSNGSICKALSSGSSAPRGFTAKILFLDEAGFISDVRYESELLPTTASYNNPLIIASTTPNGKQGWFYRYWQEMNWKHLTATRADCTWKDDEWFETKRREMTDTMYRQEFECEFLEIQNAVFNQDQVDIAFDPEVETWQL